MPVFITIQSETCFIMCPDTFPHTRYERQISPFMPHWAGTWSWIIKTNRSGETQSRTAEKRDGRQKERRAMVHFRRKSARDACRIPGWSLLFLDSFRQCSCPRPHWNVCLHACRESLAPSIGFTTVCWILAGGHHFEDSPCFGLSSPRWQTKIKSGV